jgi:hypothetical protein
MIDFDVTVVAKRWGLDPLLLQAVVKAEGDIVKAVQCSVPSVTTRAAALEVLARSATHALCDFVKQEQADAFVAFWAARWAPVGVANDPHNLNANWSLNVLRLWLSNSARPV